MKRDIQPLPHSDHLVPRSEWGAREPAGQGTRQSPHQQGEVMTQHQTPDLPETIGYEPIEPVPPKRSKLWLWITLGAVGVVVLGLGALGIAHPSPPPTVVYEVTAAGNTGGGMITMQTEDGGTSQAVVDLPFSGTSTKFHPGDFLYLSVQNQGATGSLTCRITVDGKVVSENTAVGGYTIATCQGRVS